MEAEELRFVDDALFLYKPLPQYGDGTYDAHLVMTKRIFQECYKRWIEPQESDDLLPIVHGTYQEELNDIRQDLLSRSDQYITFRDLVRRFDEVDLDFNHSPLNLLQIYSNLNVLIGEESKENMNIPYLMHKEMDIPISECQKAYDVAIDYLRSKAKLKG